MLLYIQCNAIYCVLYLDSLACTWRSMYNIVQYTVTGVQVYILASGCLIVDGVGAPSAT